MRTRTTVRLSSILVLALFLCAVNPAVAVYDVLNDTWSQPGTAGWTNDDGQVQLSNPSEYLDLQFGEQSIPSYSAAVVKKSIPAGSLATNISFRFKCFDTLPSKLRIYLYSNTGEPWHITVSPSQVGVWETFNIPLNFSVNWIMGPASSEEIFNVDIRAITWVGVYLVRNGSASEQDYGLDDFVMTGIPPPSEGEPLADSDADDIPDVWETMMGMNPTNAADATQDIDYDGMNNLAEYLAGTNPNDPLSALTAGLSPTNEVDGAQGFILTWSSTIERIYGVWWASNVMDGFQLLQGGITATPPLNTYVDLTNTNEVSFFYRVKLE